MRKNEIVLMVCEAIELLERAKPGTGDTETRRNNRAEANRIIERLPENWHRRVPDEVLCCFLSAAE
jgi:hypothetical protein